MTNQTMTLSRRTFLGGAAAVAASSMIRGAASAAPAAGPDSNFNGVQIGVITYSYRSLPGMPKRFSNMSSSPASARSN